MTKSVGGVIELTKQSTVPSLWCDMIRNAKTQQCPRAGPVWTRARCDQRHSTASHPAPSHCSPGQQFLTAEVLCRGADRLQSRSVIQAISRTAWEEGRKLCQNKEMIRITAYFCTYEFIGTGSFHWSIHFPALPLSGTNICQGRGKWKPHRTPQKAIAQCWKSRELSSAASGVVMFVNESTIPRSNYSSCVFPTSSVCVLQNINRNTELQ